MLILVLVENRNGGVNLVVAAAWDAKARGAKADAVRKLEINHMVERAELERENFMVVGSVLHKRKCTRFCQTWDEWSFLEKCD